MKSQRQIKEDDRIRFHAVYKSFINDDEILLFSSTNYEKAEYFCDNYDGRETLEIKKVWLPVRKDQAP